MRIIGKEFILFIKSQNIETVKILFMSFIIFNAKATAIFNLTDPEKR